MLVILSFPFLIHTKSLDMVFTDLILNPSLEWYISFIFLSSYLDNHILSLSSSHGFKVAILMQQITWPLLLWSFHCLAHCKAFKTYCIPDEKRADNYFNLNYIGTRLDGLLSLVLKGKLPKSPCVWGPSKTPHVYF